MKKSLVFALALMLVLAFASSAMAAQALQNGSYLSTTATGLDYNGNAPAGSAFSKVYQTSKFTVDGATYYPYEIYLPNEANPASYRIHSNYAKNTDACASCHATHTAVGASLLQWYSVYETCMACHDGTLGSATYNVEEGKIGSTSASTFGGMFGTGKEISLSNHNVTGSMEIAAAPGGSTVATEQVNGAHPGEKNTRWVTEFGCQSCHSPHGQGGNARILHPDANYAASWAAEARTDANKYFVNPADGKAYSDAAFTNSVYIIKGYPYSPKVVGNDGINVDATMKIDNTSGTTIIRNADNSATTDADVYVLGVASLKVKMVISGYLTPTESVTHVYGMNFYCGACHTDYNTAAFTTSASAASETGVYTQAHRHQMGMDWYSNTAGLKFETTKVKPYAIGSMECLTCHVAHGTSQDYWADTLLGTGQAWNGAGFVKASLTELAGSSALKRMPNMGTCEACHAKGDGSEGYNANAGLGSYTEQTGVANGLIPNTYTFNARWWDMDANDLGWVGSAKCLGCHEEYVEGWKATGHATSTHTGAGSCGQCHDPGNSIMAPSAKGFGPVTQWTTSIAAADAYLALNPFSVASQDVGGTVYRYGADVGITCESCHGTGKNHILAPSSTNIFNPGTTSVTRQAMECGRCHDMYKNVTYAKNGWTVTQSETDSIGTLSGLAGMASVPTGVYKLSDVAQLNNFSIAYRVYSEDPAKFADATQKTAVSSHYGGAWGYADSKHYLGSGTTAATANGVVSCNTCHDMHSDKNAGLLKYQYQQICASCHDASANLAQAVAMPTVSWNRHQLEFRDFAHSFKFGAPATLTNATTVVAINLEKAILGKPGTSDGGKFYTVYDNAYGSPTVDNVDQTGAGSDLATRAKTFGNWNLFRGGNAGGGIGMQVTASNGSRVYNNYEMTWELVSTPATATVANGSIIFEEGVGAIEFTNPHGTDLVSPGKDGAAKYAINGADYAKFAGNYTVKYTSKANPAVTGTVTFTVVDGTPFGTGSYTQP